MATCSVDLNQLGHSEFEEKINNKIKISLMKFSLELQISFPVAKRVWETNVGILKQKTVV